MLKQSGKKGKTENEDPPKLDEDTMKKVDAYHTQCCFSHVFTITSMAQTWPRFRNKACQMVRTHVKLIVEEDLSLNLSTCLIDKLHREDNIQAMTAALEATAFPKWKGEIDAETNLVIYHMLSH